MSFGRKGIVPGQPVAAPSGFGRAAPAAEAAPGSVDAIQKPAEPDEIAAKREAFIASERARRAQAEGGVSPPAAEYDPLINLRNMSRPATRAPQPVEAGRVGETGLPADQEEEIRALMRGKSSGYSSVGASRSSAGRAGGSGGGFIFGDPQSRTVGLAYVLWFVLGQVSLHRFYCGQKDTAIMQISLWVGSLVTFFIFPPIGLIGLIFWVFWLFADLFMIPGMLKKFKAEHDYRGVAFLPETKRSLKRTGGLK